MRGRWSRRRRSGRRRRPTPASRRSPRRSSRPRAGPRSVCSPKAGAGRVGSAGVRLIFTGSAELAHRAEPWLLHLDHHLAGADQLRVERLVDVEDRLDAAVVLVVEGLPLVAGARAEDLGDLAPGLRAGRLELLLDQVGPVDPVAEGGPELRLQRAAGDPAVGSPRRAGSRAGRRRAAARRAAAPRRRRSSGRRPSPARRGRRRPSRRRPSGPRRSARRSCSAANTPKAAIRAPPPRSAIWPPDWTGGPSLAPVSPSRPTRPR